MSFLKSINLVTEVFMLQFPLNRNLIIYFALQKHKHSFRVQFHCIAIDITEAKKTRSLTLVCVCVYRRSRSIAKCRLYLDIIEVIRLFYQSVVYYPKSTSEPQVHHR